MQEQQHAISGSAVIDCHPAAPGQLPMSFADTTAAILRHKKGTVVEVIVGKGIHSKVPKGARLRDKIPTWLQGQIAVGSITKYWAPNVTNEQTFNGSIYV